MTDKTDGAAAEPEGRGGARRWFILGLGPAVVLAGLGYMHLTSGRYISTENAFVKAEKIAVSADVSGHVISVGVTDNDVVEQGRVLFQIDPRRFEIQLESRQAELAAARQRVEAMRARYRAKVSLLSEAEDDVRFFENEYGRVERMRGVGAVTDERLEAARRDVVKSRALVRTLAEEISEALAQLGGDPEVDTDDHPTVREAKAAQRRAELDFRNTSVIAPTAAIAANVRLEPGEYVEAGRPVFALVSTEKFWVEANLKETQLTHIRIGQPATVTVDAYPGHEWSASVESPGARHGAEFTLLPPQNASGNWVKVVQRLPVRLAIVAEEDAPMLRVGMSVYVTIDTKPDEPTEPVRAADAALTRVE